MAVYFFKINITNLRLLQNTLEDVTCIFLWKYTSVANDNQILFYFQNS